MKEPVFCRPPRSHFNLGAPLQPYLDGLVDQWLLVAPMANPGMLEMFRDRNARPLRYMVPWAGEFAGKYLTSAVQNFRLNRDPRLSSFLANFVSRLIHQQDEDGYLGPWPDSFKLKNFAPNCLHTAGCEEDHITWDTWGHYLILLGVLLWHEETRDPEVLQCARRMGDLICHEFLGDKSPRLADRGWTGMNFGILHGMTLLHRATGEQRYLDLALQWVEELSARDEAGKHLACDLFEQALRNVEYFNTPNPRWEALHQVMAFADLYWITGDNRFQQAFQQIWWSIVEFDRHNNGGFSSGESAIGNPYSLAAIESCCTIAWSALSVEMLRLTGLSIAADELELTLFNSIVGMHSQTGRWATYNTPMNGIRRSSPHNLVFQAREGTPELNCCSVNAPRGFGLLSDWAIMRDPAGWVLNYYGPSEMSVELDTGGTLSLSQETRYPYDGEVVLKVDPSKPVSFILKLRIPYWSRNTTVQINDENPVPAPPGCYFQLDRTWAGGDIVKIQFDMSLHLWKGERECAGLSSIYRGPILLCYDMRYNLELAESGELHTRELNSWSQAGCVLEIPELDTAHLDYRPVQWDDWHPPHLLLEFTAADGSKVHLCDFGSAGEVGSVYCSWIPVANAPEAAGFSRENPLRSVPVE